MDLQCIIMHTFMNKYDVICIDSVHILIQPSVMSQCLLLGLISLNLLTLFCKLSLGVSNDFFYILC